MCFDHKDQGSEVKTYYSLQVHIIPRGLSSPGKGMPKGKGTCMERGSMGQASKIRPYSAAR